MLPPSPRQAWGSVKRGRGMSVCVSLTPHGGPERGIPGDFCGTPRAVGLGRDVGSNSTCPWETWGAQGEEPRGKGPPKSAVMRRITGAPAK